MGEKKIVNHDEDFEIDRPHGAGKLYNFFLDYKLKKSIEKLPFDISGLYILDTCCGSGMVSEFYAKRGANVCGTDISDECLNRAKIRSQKYEFSAKFQVADSENLPFLNNSFDIVSVHDGLHHLNNPRKAITEMVRVAKKAIIIIEPADAIITKISVLLGISKKYENVDFVYRFKNCEVRDWLISTGCKKILIKRYIMYYPHKPGKLFNILGFLVLFPVTKLLFYLVNIIFGRFGNKLQVIGLK